MIFKEFQDKKISQLGFGLMRLPLLKDGSIDEVHLEEMVEYAINKGVNYFDTAVPYHDGNSESVIGKILEKYPREQFYLADKYPGHQISTSYNPEKTFEEQLRKCKVDYFDFYLLHNVCENSIKTYLDPQWGIIEYFKEQKRLGRIRHLGFSTHGSLEMMKDFLDIYGNDMEFCQIQLNYLDWTLQDAEAKYEMLTERGIPVWVMEPVRGGKLAQLSEENETLLKERRPEESVPAWGFRFLQNLPNVTVVLSGMSEMAQMTDNVKTFEACKPLSAEETKLLFEIAEGLKKSVPCTSCRYCCEGCPKTLDIPKLISIYNDLCFAPSVISAMTVEALPDDKQPSACIKCGKCTQICPQGIEIPKLMEEMTAMLAKMPSWAEICRQREEAQKKNR